MSVGEILEDVGILLVFPSSIFSFSQAFAFHPSAEILHGRWPLHIGTSLCQSLPLSMKFLKGGIPNTMDFNMCISMYKSWSTSLDNFTIFGNLHIRIASTIELHARYSDTKPRE